MTEPEHDLFLSYASADRGAVLEIHSQLRTLGIKTFLDRSNLSAGQPWPLELENALLSCKGVAVFVGGRPELGSWQLRESWMALDLQAKASGDEKSFPVVPVLLPGADPRAGFLFLNTWVDLRKGIDRDGIDQLVKAVREPPKAAKPGSVAYTDICPYRGLEPFRRQDEPFFFGREAFTSRLLERVLAHDFVAVVGPSGSGKSSVVQAGLLPVLGRHSECRTWEVATLRPGAAPFRALGRAIIPLLDPDLTERQRLADGNGLGDDLRDGRVAINDAVERLLEKSNGSTALLLVVDQFEEVFRETPEGERKPFVEALLQAGDRTRVVLTLRADFYEHALALSRNLVDRLRLGHEPIGPLTESELESVITRPAHRVGLAFQDGLSEVVLRDVGEGLGRLPLLEFCLQELWGRRQGRELTHDGYKDIGRVEGALAQRADRAFHDLSSDLQRAAERLFTRRLVSVAGDPGAGRDTKRPALLEDLTADERTVVDRFCDRQVRLLVADEQTVEMVHEALIEQWETLKNWIASNRQRLRQERQIRDAEAIEDLIGSMVLDDGFTEPEPFLAAVADRLVVLAHERSPYEKLSETLWRLDYLAVKAERDEDRARAAAVGRDLRVELRRAVRSRIGSEPPSAYDAEFRLVETALSRLSCGSPGEVQASFCMGSEEAENEGPIHPVVLSPYLMQRKAVTQGDYLRFKPDHGEGDKNLPVVEVSWHEAYAYAAWLGGRLPSEAEWECACRAGSTGKWCFGDKESEIERYAWIKGNSEHRVHPVGELEPNAWGLYDMHGNVWEWVADWRFEQYDSGLQEDPQGPTAATSGRRVFRGGSFLSDAGNARSAYRNWDGPGFRVRLLGFRVVLPAPCRDSAVDPGS